MNGVQSLPAPELVSQDVVYEQIQSGRLEKR